MKTRIIAPLFFCLFLVSQSYASSDVTYVASAISDELKRKADAVVREYNMDFQIKSVKSGTLTTKLVVTVLNKEGQRFATIFEAYDNQKKITGFSGNVLDENGKVIRKIKMKDLKDYSDFSNSMYQDSRAKYYQYITNRYPYTIEYEVETEFDGLLFYPTWQPQFSPAVSVEKSTFSVKLPKEITFRHKEINFSDEVKIESVDGLQQYKWEVSQIEAFSREPYSPFFSELTTLVYTAPNSFEFEGYPGNMESWNSLGKWINTLNANRDILPEPTKNAVSQLVSSNGDQVETIKNIYQYLQSKTRYVSIQLGIGGFQPFSAETVDRVGYGDCKALTNYMKAMLKSANIESFYTLVRAGENNYPIQKDFPSLQFNHVILCVPVQQDTIWLECTSQENPFGYLGDFTSDRDVFIVDQQGGHISRTPTYTAEQNQLFRKVIINLDDAGNGLAKVNTKFLGLKYEDVRWILNDTKEKQKKDIYERIDIPSFELKSFEFQAAPCRIPTVQENLEINLKNYANVSGKRLFFCPNLMNQSDFIPAQAAERKSNIVIRESSIETDTVVFNLPESLHPEFFPEPIKINSAFGEYEAEFRYDQGSLTYVRRFKTNKGTFPATNYEDFRKFYIDVKKADQYKLVLKKST